jgi:hypothetical protein
VDVRSLRLIRDSHIGSTLDRLLVSAVVTILATRIYLELTGYPQIGGEGLQIAHML